MTMHELSQKLISKRHEPWGEMTLEKVNMLLHLDASPVFREELTKFQIDEWKCVVSDIFDYDDLFEIIDISEINNDLIAAIKLSGYKVSTNYILNIDLDFEYLEEFKYLMDELFNLYDYPEFVDGGNGYWSLEKCEKKLEANDKSWLRINLPDEGSTWFFISSFLSIFKLDKHLIEDEDKLLLNMQHIAEQLQLDFYYVK
jgi:hypothetical protein